MTSRYRPPLNLTDPEDPPATDDAAPPPPPPPRPMSERRRRRLAEEQRQTELAAAEAQSRPAPEPEPEVSVPLAAASAGELAPASPSTITPPVTASLPPASREPAPSGRHAYVIAGIAAALWIGGVTSWAAFQLGAGGEPDPLALAVYALIALAPAGLAIMLAHAVRQGAGLAAETRRARELSQALVAPTALAAQQTGEVLNTLRGDIDQAALAAERARNDLSLLREALSQETARLNEAAELAGRTARRLTESLARERDEMTGLGGRLETQAAGVIDAVERQSRMVVDASDLAQTQLREAEAALAARAADLAAAANEAQDAARLASDDLARQTLRLENAGAGVAEQIQSVEEGLGQQRAALVTAAYALRTDQEDFSAQVESQRAQLTEQLSAARSAAGDLNETSAQAGASVRELVEAATDQFRALVEMSQREADGFDHATKLALDRFEALAAEARDALIEETRRALAAMQATAEEQREAAAAAAEQAQLRADRLGEALFDAAQQAEAAADARVEGARRVVLDTAGLVDEAGARALERLESTLDRMTEALEQVDAAVADLDSRAARLPEEAAARADQVRQTVEEGLAALAAASRKAAEDTEALDATFQERVRRNYDMLTEAVRLMGVVSGDAPPVRRRSPAFEPPAPIEPPPAAPSRAKETSFGLRGRLRLGPTETPPPTRPSASPDARLDWSDLVEGPDDIADLRNPLPPSVEPDADEEALTARIMAAIRRMGVDPNALLPRSRVEEAAGAFAVREPDRARQIVRRVAPAAVRSVSRRVMSDPELRTDSEQYVRILAERMMREGRGDPARVMSVLATDAGRAFMLLDAAVGDLA